MTQTLFSDKDITKRINILSSQIANDYKEKNVILLGILTGSFMVLSDLSKSLWKSGLSDFEIDFLRVSSYKNTTESNRNPEINMLPSIDMHNKHVLLVEDIADTCHTLHRVHSFIKKQYPASLKTFVLLSKPRKHEVTVALDYVGFEIDNKWVEGYGLDTVGLGRGRPEIIQKTE